MKTEVVVQRLLDACHTPTEVKILERLVGRVREDLMRQSGWDHQNNSLPPVQAVDLGGWNIAARLFAK